MLVSLGLEGLFLIIIMRAALEEMSFKMGCGGRFLYFCWKRKPCSSLNRDQNLATMTAAWVMPRNSPKPEPFLG